MKDEVIENNKKTSAESDSSTNIFILICIIVVTLGIVVEIINIKRNSATNNDGRPNNSATSNDGRPNNNATNNDGRPKYWLYVDNKKEWVLKHLSLVLRRYGYEKTTNETPWDLLWVYQYPFKILKPHLLSLKPHQRVNHFPGIGFICNKVDLATTESKYIPKAFRLPKDKEEFLKYASENKKAVFVEKNNMHRGVVLKNVTDMDTKGDKFVQEFVPNPFLVDGYKFDIGVYVVMTSVDPLIVYYYSGEVLFRHCMEKYHPFDAADVKKYVIEDAYRPIWKVPSLARAHIDLGYGMKDAFDIYVRSVVRFHPSVPGLRPIPGLHFFISYYDATSIDISPIAIYSQAYLTMAIVMSINYFNEQGKDPAKMWEEIYKAIRDIFVKKEKNIIEALKNYRSKSNFFELLRVDLIVDEDMNVYLLEANMSPNLSSPNPTNQLLYEQLLYSLVSVVGLGMPRLNYYQSTASQQHCGTSTTNENYASCVEMKSGVDMLSADKNIAVWGNECYFSCKDTCEGICALCRPCLTPSDRDTLIQAYREHLHRADFRRLFPPPMTPNSSIEDLKNLTTKNQLLHMWFQGKCNIDATWCN